MFFVFDVFNIAQAVILQSTSSREKETSTIKQPVRRFGMLENQKREILTSLNAISMSFRAFKLYNESSHPELFLIPFLKAPKRVEKTGEHKRKTTREHRGNSYQLSIKHFSNDVISIFYFSLLLRLLGLPQVFTTALSTISQMLNV